MDGPSSAKGASSAKGGPPKDDKTAGGAKDFRTTLPSGATRPRREVVRAMLELAQISRGDRVYVLGCGDGAMLIGAAGDRGNRVTAIDSDSRDLALARASVSEAGLEALVEFRGEEVSTEKLRDADVVFVLLPPALQRKLQRRLAEDLEPGTRVVSWLPAMTSLLGPGALSQSKSPAQAPVQAPAEAAAGSADESGTISIYRVPAGSHPESLAPYVQTPMPVVHRMLELAGVGKDDVVFDLGCGDGRIIVEAAKTFGAHGVGIDFDSRRIEEAWELARAAGVEHLVEFRREDIMKADLSRATVVTLFLLPETNALLGPRLRETRPGTRIVTHQFPVGGWPEGEKQVLTLPDTGAHVLYLWEVVEPGAAVRPGSVPQTPAK